MATVPLQAISAGPAEAAHSGIREVVNLALVTPGCIRLEVGEPSFPTPSHIVEAAVEFARKGPVKYTIYAQLANPGDPTNDGSIVWPADRKRVELGTLSLTKVAANSDSVEKALAFNPIILTNGITLSDDPLPQLRSAVYALSVAHRH